jgi:siderophore synthetase component
MKRTQVQLDESAYRSLKRRAFERGVSMSAILRELLREEFAPAPSRRSVESFQFIGSGQSDHGHLVPISARHDEALEEDFRK